MEYIDIHHFASDDERARALTELIAVEPPPGVFGNFGPPGGYIRHVYFKDHEATRRYSSAQELQDSINLLLHIMCPGTGQGFGKVDFSDEPLLCYYSDIYRENFPVDQFGNFWVVDFDNTACFQRASPAGLWTSSISTLYPFPFGGLSHSARRGT